MPPKNKFIVREKKKLEEKLNSLLDEFIATLPPEFLDLKISDLKKFGIEIPISLFIENEPINPIEHLKLNSQIHHGRPSSSNNVTTRSMMNDESFKLSLEKENLSQPSKQQTIISSKESTFSSRIDNFKRDSSSKSTNTFAQITTDNNKAIAKIDSTKRKISNINKSSIKQPIRRTTLRTTTKQRQDQENVDKHLPLPSLPSFNPVFSSSNPISLSSHSISSMETPIVKKLKIEDNILDLSKSPRSVLSEYGKEALKNIKSKFTAILRLINKQENK